MEFARSSRGFDSRRHAVHSSSLRRPSMTDIIYRSFWPCFRVILSHPAYSKQKCNHNLSVKAMKALAIAHSFSWIHHHFKLAFWLPISIVPWQACAWNCVNQKSQEIHLQIPGGTVWTVCLCEWFFDAVFVKLLAASFCFERGTLDVRIVYSHQSCDWNQKMTKMTGYPRCERCALTAGYRALKPPPFCDGFCLWLV